MYGVYVSITIEKRKLTFNEALDAINMPNYSSLEEVPRDNEVVIRLNTTDIVIFSFVIGAVLSLIFALVYKIFFVSPSYREKISSNANDDEYIDVEFADRKLNEDFDYPYEDINEALG